MQIDKVYIISLNTHKQGVIENIASKLEGIGLEGPTPYEVITGFNGHVDELPEGYKAYSNWDLGPDHWNEWWKRPVTPGEMGCSISHYKVWNLILDNNIERALILEDDFLGTKPISALKFPNEPWDIAYLGRNALDAENEKSIDSSWVEPLSSYNTHSYIVTNNAAKILVNDYNFTKNIITPDEFLSATYTEHRREDIRALFPPKLKAIATKEDFMVQVRQHGESTTEPIDANINLMKDKIQTEEYYEILDDSNWDAWKSKYLNHTLAKGEYDLMIDDLGDNILEFQLFTDKFCKDAVALAESMDKWTQDRHEFYPTNDVLLPELGLDIIYNRVLNEVIRPLCIHYWKLEGRGWDALNSENFMARYTTDRQSHLSLHHDHSHITMVVKLNDEFEGGGTWFPQYKILSNPKRIGTATLHPGLVTHLHGARPIYAGKRFICVSFMKQQN